MNVVPSNFHEHLGPVVPVDTQSDPQPLRQSALTLRVPPTGKSAMRRSSSSPSGPITPVLTDSGTKLIGAADEHHILTTPGGQRAAQLAAASKRQNPPKFSVIVNEYVGACFEDNCNIGK